MNTIFKQDCVAGMNAMKPESVDMILTSPPYNIGKIYEKKTALKTYLNWQREVIIACSRVLKIGGSIAYQVGNYVEDGSVYPLDCLLFNNFLECGLIPRNRIVWHFEHGLHCKNRLSGRHETILWFTKGDTYKFNLDTIRVPQKYPGKKYYKGEKKGQLSGNPLGKNPGDVWQITNVKNNHPEKTEHPCQFPLDLVRPLINALSDPGNIVLDPFMGSGTVAVGALQLGRRYIGYELSEEYIQISSERIQQEVFGVYEQLTLF